MGDPLLVLAPLFLMVAFTLLALALGVTASVDALLPLISLPPVDAYQDVGIVDLGDHGAVATWILRGIALAIRTVSFGVLVRLAVQRARDEAPSLSGATAYVRSRIKTLAFLELVSFAAFGVTLTLSSDLTSGRDDAAIGTALLFGVLLLTGGFIAAGADGLPAGAALRHGLRWLRRRPLGHLLLVLLYGTAANGVLRVAAAGELGGGRALPLVLYSFVYALVTMAFVLAFARRYVLLYGEGASFAQGTKRNR